MINRNRMDVLQMKIDACIEQWIDGYDFRKLNATLEAKTASLVKEAEELMVVIVLLIICY